MIPGDIGLLHSAEVLRVATETLQPCDDEFEQFLKVCEQSAERLEAHRQLLVTQLIFRGLFQDAGRLLAGCDDFGGLHLQGWLAFIRGDFQHSPDCYQRAEGLELKPK